MQRFLLTIIVLFLVVNSNAQNLYMPRNITNAYKNETRATNGRPGSKYWQNFARYNIKLTALPPSRTVQGTEEIVYYNRSTDTLGSLVIRINLNMHKAGAPRVSPAGPDYITNGVQIDSFTENGLTQEWDNDNSFTVNTIKLSNVLRPQDSVKLKFTWHYEIAKQSSREGMLDSTTFYMAYFYPRVSVYDDYNYWDELPFLDYQEFYNDFNDYTLSVTVPKNYLVWATGALQNIDDVLQPTYSNRFKESMTSDAVMHIATLPELEAKNVTTQNVTNTWKFIARDITDVTVNVSDHYVWDAASVVVDTLTHRRAHVQAAFNDTAQDFHQMVQFGQHALGWFSNNWPGIPYPYPTMTAVQGQADMEYPMMVNDSHNDDPAMSLFAAEHEMAHTYFPFYMGINESRYPFMDEGWATTFEYLIGTNDIGKDKMDEFYKSFRINLWSLDRATEEDLPIITPGNMLTGVGYGNNAYGKPSLGYLAVKDMLGDDLFKKCLHEYMDRWHSKHPTPWDFFYTFNDVSGKNLNWFWSNWFFTNGYIDLAVENVVKNRKDNTVYIQNIGGFVAPFDLKIVYVDGTQDTVHLTSTVWQNNQKAAAVSVAGDKKVKSVQLNGGIFVDADPKNNYWMAK